MLKENKLDIIVTNADTALIDFDIRSIFFGTYHYKLVISSYHPLIKESRSEMISCLDMLDCYTHSSSLQNTDDRQRFLADSIGRTDVHIVVVPNMDSVLTAIENKQGFTVMLGCSRMCFLPYIRTYDLDKSTNLVIAHKRDASDEVIHAFINNLFRMQMEHHQV
jgi:DNA-binding transcriptional LysR family regulator